MPHAQKDPARVTFAGTLRKPPCRALWSYRHQGCLYRRAHWRGRRDRVASETALNLLEESPTTPRLARRGLLAP